MEPPKNLKIFNFFNFDSYNQKFLLYNPKVLQNYGCLIKTRAQNIHIWPNVRPFSCGKQFK